MCFLEPFPAGRKAKAASKVKRRTTEVMVATWKELEVATMPIIPSSAFIAKMPASRRNMAIILGDILQQSFVFLGLYQATAQVTMKNYFFAHQGSAEVKHADKLDSN